MQYFSKIFNSVADTHAPLKSKKCIDKPVPNMNRTLKQAIYKKRMLQNTYNKYKTSKHWEKYSKQRNLVTKLKRKSINTYFIERCVDGCKNKSFWPTVKPFLTNKGTIVKKIQFFCENETLINDQAQVCDIFNDFSVNVVNDIGQNSISINEKHPSLNSIRQNKKHVRLNSALTPLVIPL